MQLTSLLAWNEVKHTLGPRQSAVLSVLETKGPCNNLEIARYLELPINSITPRCKELRLKGLVCEREQRPCSITGRQSIIWEVKQERVQQALI